MTDAQTRASHGIMTVRILITGSRHLTDPMPIQRAIESLTWFNTAELVLIHGACPTGADALVDQLAVDPFTGCDLRRYPVKPEDGPWPSAGPRRNGRMIREAIQEFGGIDYCLAFPGRDSKGTLDCMKQAAQAGIQGRWFPVETWRGSE